MQMPRLLKKRYRVFEAIFVVMRMLIAFLLVAANGFAQVRFSSDTVVKGQILDFKMRKPAKFASVQVYNYDSLIVEITATDSGSYWLSNQYIFPNRDYRISYTWNDIDTCWSAPFIGRVEKWSTTGITEDSLPLSRITLVNYATICRTLPEIFFVKNTSEIDSVSRSAMRELLCSCARNESLVIEVIGAVNPLETDPEHLAIQRATMVREWLMAAGIISERLKIGYREASVPYIMEWGTDRLERGSVLTEEFVEGLETEEAKNEAIRYIGAVGFRILRNDYVPND